MVHLYMEKAALTWLLLTCDDVRASRACNLCTTLAMSRCSLIRAAATCSLTFAPAARLLCDTQQGASTPAHSPELQVALDAWEAEKKSWCRHLRDTTSASIREDCCGSPRPRLDRELWSWRAFIPSLKKESAMIAWVSPLLLALLLSNQRSDCLTESARDPGGRIFDEDLPLGGRQ